jgi:hypothetical protein
MYLEELYKRIPAEELELLTREIEMCRDAGGDSDYEISLAEHVAATIYTEIDVEFVTCRQSTLYHAFTVNTEGGHRELGFGQSKVSFWKAFRAALINMGFSKIEPDQDWDG